MPRPKAKQLVWECACGHIEHSIDMPEDCSRCFSVGKFEKVPEDLWEEKEAREILSLNPVEEEEDQEYDED